MDGMLGRSTGKLKNRFLGGSPRWGCWTLSSSLTYRMEGKGTYTFKNGTKYVGQMKDGEYVVVSEGYGRPNSLTIGLYLYFTRFHGHGVLHFQDGGTFEAEWEHGRAVGTTPSQVCSSGYSIVMINFCALHPS